MATAVIMPRQGQSVESCIIGKWHKKKGDMVQEGDLLFTYETDKATFDETARVSGEMLEVYFEEGDDVPCLLNVCVIGARGEDTSSFSPAGSTAPAAAQVAAPSANEAMTAPAMSQSLAPVASSPDADAVIMPRQGQSVESCIIGKWHKSVGDKVSVGDLLFTYETDKATFDEMSKFEGEMLAIFFEAGDDVPCLMNVCAIGKPGADAGVFDPRGTGTAQASSAAPTVSAPAAPTVSASAAAATSAMQSSAPSAVPSAIIAEAAPKAISPRAKALANKQGADLRFAQPSGPKGRIIERDVLRLIDEGHLATQAAGNAYDPAIVGSGIGGRVSAADIAAAAAPVQAPAAEAAQAAVILPESYEEKHTNIRKIIGKAMHESLSTMAQLTLNASFDATDIIELRAKLKKAKESGLADQLGLKLAAANPTFNDIILYAVSRVLKNHRMCNAHYYPDKMVYFNTVNLGMAVDTPRGLMVPTLFGADRMSITEISKQAKSLAAECQKGTISPDLLKNGTITITNLGTLGIESFTPVINPPQTCILGVNTITTQVRNVNGRAVPYQSMSLSLTFDHRALDGAPAARFLKELKDTLENFSLLLIE
ncbi:MAG: 2-oxo acid dehydrogenase subunit E2 [Saccharofermentanales bacterium]